MPAKVSQFPAAARPLTGTELFGLAQGGTNTRVTTQDYYDDFVEPDIINLQNQINSLDVGSALLLTYEIDTATYTIAAEDIYVAFELTYPGMVEIVIPLNATEAVPVGSRIRFCDLYGSAVIIPETVDVTLVSRGNALTSRGAGAIFEVHKVALDRWWILGDVQE